MKSDSGYTNYEKALELVQESIVPAGIEDLPVGKCTGYVSAGNATARVTSPSVRTSMKDGFAVRTGDSIGDQGQHKLKIVGSVGAGGIFEGVLFAGQAVRVYTGAPVPEGADTVVPSEMCKEQDEYVTIRGVVTTGQDIAPAGDTIKKGETIVEKGMLITPAVVSYAVTGGIGSLSVYRKPRFGLIGIGDELAEQGSRLQNSQLYASNLAYNAAWLDWFGVPYESALLPDNEAVIKNKLTDVLRQADAIITSGGVMGSERDVTVGALDSLGWNMKFRYVRMRPGKATAFGLLQGKPVFCFSGGPHSNALAFLEFALPAIYRMMKIPAEPLRMVKASLRKEIMVRNPDWTEFREGRLDEDKNGNYSVEPPHGKSRMQSMAAANCLIYVPEGIDSLKKGQFVTVQKLPWY